MFLDNYIVAGALDGGTQVISFILNLAVFGAVGDAHAFPEWWGNDLSAYPTLSSPHLRLSLVILPLILPPSIVNRLLRRPVSGAPRLETGFGGCGVLEL